MPTGSAARPVMRFSSLLDRIGIPTYVIAQLLNASGMLMTASAANGTIGPITLTEGGTYTILVRSGNVQVSGFGYGINLQFTKGQCAALISCGQSLSGSMDAPAEQDAYRFSGTVGDVVLITAASVPGSPTYVIAQLFNPAGMLMKASPANGTIGPSSSQPTAHTPSWSAAGMYR